MPTDERITFLLDVLDEIAATDFVAHLQNAELKQQLIADLARDTGASPAHSERPRSKYAIDPKDALIPLPWSGIKRPTPLHFTVHKAKSRMIFTLERFCENLRRFNYYSLLSHVYRGNWHADETFKHLKPEIIRSLSPILLPFAAAVANPHRKRELANPQEYAHLAQQYIHVNDDLGAHRTFEPKVYLDAIKQNDIFDFCIYEEDFTALRIEFIINSITPQQNIGTRNLHVTIAIIYRMLSFLSTRCDLAVNDTIAEKYGCSLKQLLQIIISFYAFFKSDSSSFQMHLSMNSDLSCVAERIRCTQDQIIKVAQEISYSDKLLRSEWLDGVVFKTPRNLQKFCPSPLASTPLVCLEKIDRTRHSFTATCERDFFDSSAFHILRSLYANQSKAKIGDAVGTALESYVFDLLRERYGDRVSRIVHDGKKADIAVELDHIILVIETKSSIGNLDSFYVLSPQNIAKIWGRLYPAYKQCVALSQFYSHQTHKPIVAMVIFLSNISSQQLAFVKLLVKKGIIRRDNLLGLEIVSLAFLANFLEYFDEFELGQRLQKKWEYCEFSSTGSMFQIAGVSLERWRKLDTIYGPIDELTEFIED